MRLGDANPRGIPGRGDMPSRVPGDPQDAPDGPEADDVRPLVCAAIWPGCRLVGGGCHVCAEDEHAGPHLCTCGASL